MPKKSAKKQQRKNFKGGDDIDTADFAEKLSQLTSRAQAGGGSDWVNSLYSAGPVNSPVQSQQEYSAFNQSIPYNSMKSPAYDTSTSAGLDKYLCNGGDVPGRSSGSSLFDSSAESYAPAGGARKKRKSPKRKSASAKRKSASKKKKSASAKRKSGKKSGKKRGGNLFPLEQTVTLAGLLGLKEYTKRRSPKKHGKKEY